MKTIVVSGKAENMNILVAEDSSVTQKVYCWTVGILNPEALKTKELTKEAIAFADPERRFKPRFDSFSDLDYNTIRTKRLAELGVVLDSQFSVADSTSVKEHIRRRNLYVANKQALFIRYSRSGSLANAIWGVLSEFIEDED